MVNTDEVKAVWENREITDEEAEFDREGQRLRELWAEAYRRFTRERTVESQFRSIAKWDGGQDSFGRKFQSVWGKLAKSLMQRGLNFESAVRAAFNKPGTEPPTPNQLTSDAVMQRYKEAALCEAEDAERHFQLQIAESNRQIKLKVNLYSMDTKSATISVLSDLSANLSALYRFCMAYSLNLQHVAAMWYTAAAEQYLEKPEVYDRAWTCIPSDFASEIKGRRALLAGNETPDMEEFDD